MRDVTCPQDPVVSEIGIQDLAFCCHHSFGERISYSRDFSTRYLALYVRRVDRLSHIKGTRELQDFYFTGLGIHFHFSEVDSKDRRPCGSYTGISTHDLIALGQILKQPVIEKIFHRDIDLRVVHMI